MIFSFCILVFEDSANSWPEITGLGHNVGYGEDIEIKSLAETVCRIIGFEGQIELDTTKPDGTPRKLMSADKIRNLGWSPSITLEDGIAQVYQWFLANVVDA